MNSVMNYMEIWVEEYMKKLIQEYGVCKCDNCKKDIFALALNNLQPCYIATSKGRVMTKLQRTQQQFDTDITVEVTRAIEQVMSNPNHNII